MSTPKKKPVETKKVTKTGLQPVWKVGYGSHTLMLAADTAEDAMHEAAEKDPVLAALPISAEAVVTDDGFPCMAQTSEEDDIL